jgi:hypothetical protein
MFETEIAINEFLMAQFVKIVADLPDDSLFVPAAGHGHPPVWILGHLAIAGEMGQRQLGGKVTHLEWLRLFGPGSTDQVEPRDDLKREDLGLIVVETYRELRNLSANATEATVARPHGVKLFEGTSIRTVQHAVAMVLTNHFGFHLAQLSSCRRVNGQGPLF